jgi:hypothetical protein
MKEPMRNSIQREEFWPTVALRCLLLAGVILLPGAITSIGLQRCLSECEAPFDKAESSEAAVLRVQSHTRRRHPDPGTQVLIVDACATTLRWVGDLDRAAPAGHRLTNHLLAPLRL